MLLFIFGGPYMTKLHKLDYESPIGVIEIMAADDAIISAFEKFSLTKG